MEKHDIIPKLAVIISDNSLIYDNLTENVNCRLELINSSYSSYITDFGKIDVLIVDKKLFEYDLFLFRINIIVNCTDKKLSYNEIRFDKPFKLADLIEIVEKNQNNENLFCCINKEWIYDRKLGIISSTDRSISLTDRENDILKELLTLKYYKADKEYLLRAVWNYHQDTESNTVETHLYKLKQKLPAGLMEIKDSACFLNITDLK